VQPELGKISGSETVEARKDKGVLCLGKGMGIAKARVLVCERVGV